MKTNASKGVLKSSSLICAGVSIYGAILTRFPRAYTHPQRNMETELGDLMAEGMRKQLGVDLVMLGSGSIRKSSLGPIVMLKDYMEGFPFVNPMVKFNLTGEQLRRIIHFLMREEAFVDEEHCEWYQFSDGFFCEYDRAAQNIIRLTMFGKEVQNDDVYTISMQRYHFLSCQDFLGISIEEIEKNGCPIEIAINSQNVLQEFFSSNDYIKMDNEKRFLIHM